jgi:four helix bundle protein
MTTDKQQPGARPFIALEIALLIIESLRSVVALVRRHDVNVAQQIVRSASSIVANLAEGNGRQGKDRVRFFRIAAGSAEETRAHLRVALAWGWVRRTDVDKSLELIDREVALLWRLTH